MKLQQLLNRSFLFIVVLVGTACGISVSEGANQDLPIPAETTQFRVEVVAENLEVPWTIRFAPDGRMFFTERPGRVRVIENGKLRQEPFAVIIEVEPSGENGLMGMVLHPDFTTNHYIYLAYAYSAKNGKEVRVARYRENGETLVEPKTIIEGIDAARFHAGTRLGFGPDDGKLYITTGDATKQKRAQRLDSLNGKTLRLNDDGTIPQDNPFVGKKNARPEIWTYGHRNAQGMDWQPGTNLMFQTEHGPTIIDGVSLFGKRTGGDEVNIVEKGKNYGWAKISHEMTREGMETPLVEYSPAIAPASGMFYTGEMFPEFKGNFFIGALKGKAIIRLVLDGRKIVSQERLLEKEYGRIREVAQSPDGAIYFSTSNRDGRGDAAATDDRIFKIVKNDK